MSAARAYSESERVRIASGVLAIRRVRVAYNRAYVRALLMQRDPWFAAALESAVRELTS